MTVEFQMALFTWVEKYNNKMVYAITYSREDRKTSKQCNYLFIYLKCLLSDRTVDKAKTKGCLMPSNTDYPLVIRTPHSLQITETEN